MPRADVLLDGGRFTFSSKLLLVKALDVVSDDILSSVKALNKVRNLCAHELDYKVTEANIDMIGRPFGKSYMEIKRQHAGTIIEHLRFTLITPLARLEASYDKLIAEKREAD